MSLNKALLVEQLIAVFTNEQTEQEDATASVDRIANGMANAIDAFVKTGQVNVTVATTGTATSQTGTGTGNIT